MCLMWFKKLYVDLFCNFTRLYHMLAAIITANPSPVTLAEMPLSQPKAGESLVRLAASALNHRDVWITKGLYAGIRFPCILGSDGAGWVDDREVVIYPLFDWGDDPRVQSKQYRILGMPDNGTFAEFVAVPDQLIFPKPAHLPMEAAAALPLAGLTAFRTLFTKGATTGKDRVLITGIGGGVALFALQFALAAGAEVWVTSGSEEKIQKAVALGAAGGANYTRPGWEQTLLQQSSGFDVIVDGAAGEGFGLLIKLSRPGGRIGVYGGTRGAIPNISPQAIFYKQLSIFGSTMGTPEEFGQMLDFVSQHRLQPVIDRVFPLENAPDAFERMEKGSQFGKIVLRNP